MNSLISLLIVFTALAVVVVTGIGLWLFARGQSKNVRRTMKLELRNDGNVPGRYALKAEDPTGSLRFQWALNGSPLGAQQVPQILSAPQLPPPQVTKPVEPSGATPSAGMLKSAAGAVAEILMTVGHLLPGSLGGPLVNLGSQIRYGEYTAERVSTLPGQVTRLNPMGDGGAVYATGSNQRAYIPSASPSAVASAPALATAAADVWAQTPAVPPGGSLALELVIAPIRAQHFQQYNFKVTSKSVEQPDLMVSESGAVSIAGISALQRLLPFAIFAAVALFTLACSSYLLANQRIFGG